MNVLDAVATNPAQIASLRNYLEGGRILVITGAGVSTGSGIGDYRDERGEWKRGAPIMHDPYMQEHATRQRYWARSQVGFPQFAAAVPNVVHDVLARWETAGLLCGLITQNVDGLHSKAGHQQVLELHGNLHQVVCMSCGAQSSRAGWQHWLETHNPLVSEDFYTPAPDGDADTSRQNFSEIAVPACELCGGIVKPDVVFYGGSVAKAVVQTAYDWVDQARVVLVLGSSLMVYSSFRFARRAHTRGIPLLAVNKGHTRADELLTMKLDAECGAVLTALALAD